MRGHLFVSQCGYMFSSLRDVNVDFHLEVYSNNTSSSESCWLIRKSTRSVPFHALKLNLNQQMGN
jgi:hypothetical protein